MKTQNFKLVIVVISVLALLVTPVMDVKAKPLATLPPEIEAVLLNYSQYLKTGTTARKAEFSPQMNNLASERQEYYKEFFAKGLHANLDTIDAQFVTDQDIIVTQKGNVYFVDVNEKVTMAGKPATTSPEDYPLIQAAKWALTQTDNENIKAELNRYIESMTRGVKESVQGGVEIVFWNKHNIEIKEEKGQFQIIKDTFTDKAPDNGKGFDNITWAQGRFTRGKPSWDMMIDYKIYNTSIEALGQNLLTDFQPSADRPTETLATVNYFRWNARSYAVYWSSNPPATSQCGTTLRRDTTKWNPSYKYLWNANDTIRCNNCADYVSQALRNGALPPDSIWKPDLASLAWVNVDALRNYLVNKYPGGIYLISFSSLQVGDLTIIPGKHVAIVTNVNPHQVSGHTNDRVNYGIGPTTYSQFLHISDYP